MTSLETVLVCPDWYATTSTSSARFITLSPRKALVVLPLDITTQKAQKIKRQTFSGVTRFFQTVLDTLQNLNQKMLSPKSYIFKILTDVILSGFNPHVEFVLDACSRSYVVVSTAAAAIQAFKVVGSHPSALPPHSCCRRFRGNAPLARSRLFCARSGLFQNCSARTCRTHPVV